MPASNKGQSPWETKVRSVTVSSSGRLRSFAGAQWWSRKARCIVAHGCSRSQAWKVQQASSVCT
eukprot:6491648-Amphidinium_carterae.2